MTWLDLMCNSWHGQMYDKSIYLMWHAYSVATSRIKVHDLAWPLVTFGSGDLPWHKFSHHAYFQAFLCNIRSYRYDQRPKATGDLWPPPEDSQALQGTLPCLSSGLRPLKGPLVPPVNFPAPTGNPPKRAEKCISEKTKKNEKKFVFVFNNENVSSITLLRKRFNRLCKNENENEMFDNVIQKTKTKTEKI